MKGKKRILMLFSCIMVISAMIISCDDNNSYQKMDIVQLSAKKLTVKVDEELSVAITLSDQNQIKTILIEKTRDGKKAEDFIPVKLDVATIKFPYTFTDIATMEDEEGIPVYSFYGLDANGNVVDVTDLIVNIEVTQLKRLQKFDWEITAQVIAGKNIFIDDPNHEASDNTFRYNADWSWEYDWGTKVGLEVLNATCAYKIIGTENKIDSIYTISYSIFDPNTPVVTKYKVGKLDETTLELESIQDLSAFDYSSEELVIDRFVAVPQSSSFVPYRGSNPADYIIPSCNPGSY